MFSNAGREFRHNPCLMAPVTFMGLLVLCLFWTLTMLWKFPLFFLGYLLSPFINRTQFVIEFLYPSGLGRWVHLSICRMVQQTGRSSKAGDKNRGFHSRAVETRIEVIPGRLYIHPIPQLLDNLAYLVLCCPEQNQGNDQTLMKQPESPSGIVAFMVDCADAAATIKMLDNISQVHYHNQRIRLQAILSTHKHHDHTAGNIPMFKNQAMKHNLKIVVGGAVEKVPGCNYTVADGDILDLPKHGNNDMADLIQVEAVATPAHTRGSITYVLRVKPEFLDSNSAYAFLFTGDTMFSGGGGVPFEADVDPNQEQQEHKKSFTSIIKATSSHYAVERCFGLMLKRAITSKGLPRDMADRVLIMPGHEYTHELLARQMTSGNIMESCRWKNFSPHVFFQTVSQFYVALHRRSLPTSSGKLITAMGSPISLELSINPFFRNMRKRGENIIQAIQFWHQEFARQKVQGNIGSAYYCHFANENASTSSRNKLPSQKSFSNETQWNLDAAGLGQPIFTTVYSSDLDLIIRDLSQGAISSQEGAKRLSAIKDRLKESTVSRRPLPGSLPSDRAVYRGLLALALLGSAPSALTLYDSRQMKLPPPVNQSSDRIQISRDYLISVLQWLGLITPEGDGPRLIAMIYQLWREAHEDSSHDGKIRKSNNYETIDSEADPLDIIELGDLKWTIYGVPRQQSLFHYCMPCSKPQRVDPHHPAFAAGMKPNGGEIVRHDIHTCPMCRLRAGCPYLPEEDRQQVLRVDKAAPRHILTSIGSAEDTEDGFFVEMTSLSLLKES